MNPDLKELAQKLAEAYSNFYQTAVQLPVTKQNQSGVCGSWSPKQVVAHLNGWDDSLLTFITDIDNFEPPQDVDLFNIQSVAERDHLSWDEMLTTLERTHTDLQTAVSTVSPHMKIYPRVHSWLQGRRADYELHQGQLAAWLPNT